MVIIAVLVEQTVYICSKKASRLKEIENWNAYLYQGNEYPLTLMHILLTF